MKYGLYYLLDYHPELHGSTADVYRQLLAQVVQAEDWGYDSVWFAEHHFQRYGGIVPSPMLLGAAVARETRRIRIGLGCSLLPYHRPVRIAEDAAMLDILSEGRLEFGIGRGFLKWEHDNLGIPMDESRVRFQEGIDVILKAWTEERFDYEGSRFSYRDLTVLPRPVQQPHPPVWVAATRTPDTFRWIGERGFHPMIVPFIMELESTEALLAVYRAAARARGTAMPELFATFHVYVREDQRRAVAEGERYFTRYLATHEEAGTLARPATPVADFAHHVGSSDRLWRTAYADLWAQQRVIVGDPDHCAAALAALQRRLGITHFAGLFNFGGMPHEDVLRSLRLFREQVIPRVEAARAAAAGGRGDAPGR